MKIIVLTGVVKQFACLLLENAWIKWRTWSGKHLGPCLLLQLNLSSLLGKTQWNLRRAELRLLKVKTLVRHEWLRTKITRRFSYSSAVPSHFQEKIRIFACHFRINPCKLVLRNLFFKWTTKFHSFSTRKLQLKSLKIPKSVLPALCSKSFLSDDLRSQLSARTAWWTNQQKEKKNSTFFSFGQSEFSILASISDHSWNNQTRLHWKERITNT